MQSLDIKLRQARWFGLPGCGLPLAVSQSDQQEARCRNISNAGLFSIHWEAFFNAMQCDAGLFSMQCNGGLFSIHWGAMQCNIVQCNPMGAGLFSIYKLRLIAPKLQPSTANTAGMHT